MTYTEANKFMYDNWDIVSPELIASQPPHMRLNCIIAPTFSEPKILQAIYIQMTDEQKNNEDILFDMGLIGNNLGLYVCFMMKGHIYFLPFEGYSTIPWIIDDGNKS